MGCVFWACLQMVAASSSLASLFCCYLVFTIIYYRIQYILLSLYICFDKRIFWLLCSNTTAVLKDYNTWIIMSRNDTFWYSQTSNLVLFCKQSFYLHSAKISTQTGSFSVTSTKMMDCMMQNDSLWVILAESHFGLAAATGSVSRVHNLHSRPAHHLRCCTNPVPNIQTL